MANEQQFQVQDNAPDKVQPVQETRKGADNVTDAIFKPGQAKTEPQQDKPDSAASKKRAQMLKDQTEKMHKDGTLDTSLDIVGVKDGCLLVTSNAGGDKDKAYTLNKEGQIDCEYKIIRKDNKSDGAITGFVSIDSTAHHKPALDSVTKVPDPSYRGEDIHRAINPGEYKGKPGDTLAGIAEKHLGKNALPEEVKAYTIEIAKRNGLDPDNPGKLEGKMLHLPGNTKDGGYIVETREGETHTQRILRKDGSELIQHNNDKDQRGYERHSTPDNGYTEKHWGPRPSDKYMLAKTGDGRYLIADKPGDIPREVPPANEAVRVERNKLEHLAETKIKSPEELAKFHADMLRFEERATRQDPPLSPEEVVKTYKQVEHLLSSRDTPAVPGVKEKDRLNLAEQIMSQSATPSSCDQGARGTCFVASIEARTYTRNPSEAARLVTEVATTGKYSASDGTEVPIESKSIKANDPEARRNPPNDGERGHASQIFQVTAVNLLYKTHSYDYEDENGKARHVPPGKLKYIQTYVAAGKNPPEHGDYLVDTSRNPEVRIMEDWKKKIPVADGGGGSSTQIAYMSRMISGKNDTVELSYERNPGAVYGVDGAKGFKNETQFREQIIQAAKEHKFPILMGVHTGNEPLLHDSGGGKAGGSGGWHEITITGYDAKTGCVSIDNQWGSKYDHLSTTGIPIHDLYMTSRPPDYEERAPDGRVIGGTEYDLKKEVDSNRQHHIVNTDKELQLLKLQHMKHELSDEEYVQQLKGMIEHAAQRWDKQKGEGTYKESEHDKAMEKLKDMTDALLFEQWISVLQTEVHNKLMNRQEYSSCLQHERWDVEGLPPEDRLFRLPNLAHVEVLTPKEYDQALEKTFRDYRAKDPPPNAADQREFAAAFTDLVNGLPVERRQAIMRQVKQQGKAQ